MFGRDHRQVRRRVVPHLLAAASRTTWRRARGCAAAASGVVQPDSIHRGGHVLRVPDAVRRRITQTAGVGRGPCPRCVPWPKHGPGTGSSIRCASTSSSLQDLLPQFAARWAASLARVDEVPRIHAVVTRTYCGPPIGDSRPDGGMARARLEYAVRDRARSDPCTAALSRICVSTAPVVQVLRGLKRL